MSVAKSLYGTVHFTVPAAKCLLTVVCCAHAHIGSCTGGCKGERALSFLRCQAQRAGGR
ncbi:hypothetical protein B7P43_G16987 [Cryptotermes secundus]|uniref:Uncharacterized protein n=1 Tax=Cryptotermes secundus TaxID=105785 RepID=A0A2J7Q591_9NEOP|nr:hypothetical protein B7P43_G16987 [Cryptotermes secundus]